MSNIDPNAIPPFVPDGSDGSDSTKQAAHSQADGTHRPQNEAAQGHDAATGQQAPGPIPGFAQTAAAGAPSRSSRWKPLKKRYAIIGGVVATALALVMAGGAAALELTGADDSSNAATAEQSGSGSTVDLSQMDMEYSKRDTAGTYDEAEAVSITLADSGTTVTAGANAAEGAADAVSVDGSTITISDEGVYLISGTLSDGQILVTAEDTDKVQLVLADASITNADGPAISIQTADKAFITLAENTSNTLADGSSYALDADSDEPYATLYSKCDLTINGSGSLTVDANYRHGICSKDELKICGGAITVDAVEDGIRGRDSLMISDGTITVTAGGDAFKSNRDDDATRGFIAIDGGAITVNAGDDAFHAETALLVRDGNVTVESCEEGYEATLVQIEGGTSHITSSDDAINASAGSIYGTSSSASTGTVSLAGLADSSSQDASASTLSTVAGPGGAAGGMGGQTPPDMGGSTAGGMNDGAAPDASSGQTPSGGMGGGADMGSEADNTACQLNIYGGVVVLDAEGDALDSNGSISITGGTVIANGSSGNVEVALDYNGTATVSGGTVLLAGASGMAQSFSGGDQAFGMAQASGSAGQTITLADANGNVIASMVATNDFSCVVASATELTEGSTYQIVVGGTITGGTTDSDGVTTGGTVSGGSATTFTASTQGSTGMGAGGMGGAPGMGDQQGRMDDMKDQSGSMRPGSSAGSSQQSGAAAGTQSGSPLADAASGMATTASA